MFRRPDDGGVIPAHAMGAQYRDAFGAPYYGVHRAALQQILVATLGPGVVEPGNRCIGVVQDDPAAEVRVDFENGHTVTADLVVVIACEAVRYADARDRVRHDLAREPLRE